MTQDTMTQRHQRFYELVTPDGEVWRRTTDRQKAAMWHGMCRRPYGLRVVNVPGLRIRPRLAVWFASQRTDQDDLERWHAHLDRAHGL